MGSVEGDRAETEHLQHEVTVSAFRILRHEVTNAEYRRLVPDHDYAGARGDDDRPVDTTWYEAYTYAAWLGGRLPTEAEWEYAARADCRFEYCARDGRQAALENVSWSWETCSWDAQRNAPLPSPVMRLEPNPWGIYDMMGNLEEWTVDLADSVTAEAAFGLRVRRGGSCNTRNTRVTRREFGPPGFDFDHIGVRVLLPTS